MKNGIKAFLVMLAWLLAILALIVVIAVVGTIFGPFWVLIVPVLMFGWAIWSTLKEEYDYRDK